jgi:predicted alpha/beta hydrolase
MQENRVIRTKDGREIHAICYLSGESTGKVIIIGPAANATQQYYKPLAILFRRLEYDVVTFDYRGMGKSMPEVKKGFDAALHQWAVQDADAVIRYARSRFTGKEIIFVGHGISGEIIGLAQASQYIHKLVLVNSALSCKKLWPTKYKFRIWALKVATRLMYALYPQNRFLKNLPKGVVVEWANWCNNPNGLFDAYPDNNYQKLQIPILAFSFADDWHCPPKAVRELLNRFCGATITWHHMKPIEMGVKRIGHSGFFDPGMKSTLWVLLDQWLNEDYRNNDNSNGRQALFNRPAI